MSIEHWAIGHWALGIGHWGATALPGFPWLFAQRIRQEKQVASLVIISIRYAPFPSPLITNNAKSA
ncbi:MAG: hypothetical protein V7K48_22965 [Nostoc sp.]|uniref:hypothetical protein n=1 Tax=Nostoc sp. TaxID=1180 RepID=UPI002FF65443